MTDAEVSFTDNFKKWGVLFDWLDLTVIVVFGTAIGILGLYIGGFVLTEIARLFGGRASMGAMRAALAWGKAPSAIGLLICLFLCVGLNLSDVSNSPTLTVALQLIAGALALWALIWLLLMYRCVGGFGYWRAIVSLVVALVVAAVVTLSIPLAIRAFLFQPFSMPSGSMLPTLLVGDQFFVSKYSYGYTRYSLPFSLPLFSGRVWASEPQRGDVAVFRLPKDNLVDYVKRIVGLPGDRIQMISGVLNINGAPVKHERVDDYITNDGGIVQRVKRYRETLPNGVSYMTIDLTDTGFYDNTPVYTVPAGHYFVIGDNLDNSTDSRVMSQVGYVPFENLIGRVEIIFFSIDRESGAAQPTIRFERIGMIVH